MDQLGIINHYLWTNHISVTTRCGATVRRRTDNCNPRHAVETCTFRRLELGLSTRLKVGNRELLARDDDRAGQAVQVKQSLHDLARIVVRG